MQTIYNKDNIKLNYLNAYVMCYLNNDNLYLYNTLYNKKVTIKSSNKYLRDLLTSLHRGVNYNNLIEILQNISKNPKELYMYLLQNFIVE